MRKMRKSIRFGKKDKSNQHRMKISDRKHNIGLLEAPME
jgi:hypothetical protein